MRPQIPGTTARYRLLDIPAASPSLLLTTLIWEGNDSFHRGSTNSWGSRGLWRRIERLEYRSLCSAKTVPIAVS